MCTLERNTQLLPQEVQCCSCVEQGIMKVIEKLLLWGQIYLGLYSLANTLDWGRNPCTATGRTAML